MEKATRSLKSTEFDLLGVQKNINKPITKSICTLLSCYFAVQMSKIPIQEQEISGRHFFHFGLHVLQHLQSIYGGVCTTCQLEYEISSIQDARNFGLRVVQNEKWKWEEFILLNKL